MAVGRRRWDAATKARLIAAASQSSVSSVARAHGLNVGQLYAWRRRQREERDRDQRNDVRAFVPVIVAEDAPSASTMPVIEIALAGGRVVIRGGIDAQVVGAVLAALK